MVTRQRKSFNPVAVLVHRPGRLGLEIINRNEHCSTIFDYKRMMIREFIPQRDLFGTRFATRNNDRDPMHFQLGQQGISRCMTVTIMIKKRTIKISINNKFRHQKLAASGSA